MLLKTAQQIVAYQNFCCLVLYTMKHSSLQFFGHQQILQQNVLIWQYHDSKFLTYTRMPKSS